MQTLTRTTALRLGAAVLCATAAAAMGGGPASAAASSSAAKATAPTAVSGAIAVRPNTVGYPDCGEEFTVTGTVVNVRAGSGTSARIISEAYKGDEFTVDFRTSLKYDDYYWAYGYDLTRNGPVGYIAMSYLHDTGHAAGCTYLN